MSMRFLSYGTCTLSGIVLVLGGCGAFSRQSACHFPDSLGSRAPAWVCERQIADGPVFQALGIATPSSNVALAEKRAIADARVKLASRVETGMKALLRESEDEVRDVSGPTSYSSVTDIVTSAFVDHNLVGSYVLKSAQSPGGYYYVLLAQDAEATMRMLDTAIAAARQGGPALAGALAGHEEALARLTEMARGN